MNTNKNTWEALTLPFNEDVHDALQQQHHAAQFIALAGRHLIPQQPDDSNTNMQYYSESDMLLGNPLANGYRLGLHLSDLELYMLDKDYFPTGRIPLIGKSRQQVFAELKQRLDESGIDASKLNDELHYEVPAHPVANGSAFEIKDIKLFKENALYRHNAEIVLNVIAADYPDAEPVHIWPHHYDTGTIIPLSYNDDGKLSRSLGLGWAIPDSMVNEPYYYLSLWSEQAVDNFKELPALKSGEWITTGWTGGVLRLSEILQSPSAEVQYEKTKLFFQSGIEILTKHYK